MKKSLLLTTLLTILGTASSWAAFVTWDLNPGNLDQVVGSPTHTFTSAGFNLTATGYDHNTVGSDTFHQLFYKNEPMEGGAIERGLGLFNTNANELNLNPDGSVGQYIQFDLRSLL